MYFGTSRLEYLDANDSIPSTNPTEFNFRGDPDLIGSNSFQLQGIWQLFPDKAVLSKTGGKIKLHFSAAKVFMVASSKIPQTLKIIVEGKTYPDVQIMDAKLYTLFDSDNYAERIIEIEIPEAGFEAFTFTFG
jgi:hypothetical protein